ncbi:PREDICTED: uncharacterized protein LOC109342422 [Lupinus angustifolius]|uniref:uncharacterized protein LOC109342422 n=1 Tax=Lupinus angustifolius TaxID=3871 RepID=UPI00092E5B62|nr:PREDICTED: uncharacterized protein LOC109342422 [Lupinus angustifolius]
MKVEDLQGSLEAHEQRLMERSIERPVEQALQAHRSRSRGRNFRGGNFKNSQQRDQERMDIDESEGSIKRWGFNQWRGGRNAMDRKKIKCFNCGKIDYFSNEYKASPSQSNNRSRQHNESHMAKEEVETENDDQPLLLMMVTIQVSKNNDTWYIDSGCSSHMTRHREWLVNFDEKRKNNVRFADNRVIQAKGTDDVLIKRKDDKHAMITDVLYVPNMRSNLISMGQLLEKGFSMELLNGFLEIYDQKKKLVMRAIMASNKTF